MRILKFNLNGVFAHFKNPEINTDVNLTFNQIHKVALKGIIGATIGLGGYNTAAFKDEPVEFLEKLQNLKIGIVPNTPKGVFDKQVNGYSNTTGFASTEEGGILLIYEQVLVQPDWDIYLDMSSIEKQLADKIEDYILNSKSEYYRYLGNHQYIANIENPMIIESEVIKNPDYISSLFDKSNIVFDDLINDKEDLAYGDCPFYNSFFLPWDIDGIAGYHKYYRSLYLTNYYIEEVKDNTNRLFIQDQDRIIELL